MRWSRRSPTRSCPRRPTHSATPNSGRSATSESATANGYRLHKWGTWAGTVAIPKLSPQLPELAAGATSTAEQALISVVATAYLLGVSTRRIEKPAESLGVTQLSKSQVSAMVRHLDEQVTAFRNRPLDAGPYAFVCVDALTQKIREGGRVINVHALIGVGVNADGHRDELRRRRSGSACRPTRRSSTRSEERLDVASTAIIVKTEHPLVPPWQGCQAGRPFADRGGCRRFCWSIIGPQRGPPTVC
ncbi:transposase [Streptomyces carpinensis]|uniref:transposase n=1 Tax=Streptomyces carpinensis TaxID=66369 RepID=UPI001302A74D